MGSGGSNTPTQQNVTQTNLPEYARPYFERMMARTEATSNDPYKTYSGPRVEGLNGVQNQGIGGLSNLQQPNEFNKGSGALQASANGLLGEAGYTSNPIRSNYNANDVRIFGAPAQVQATYQPGEFGAADAQKYMSPYQQQVTDIAKREAIRQNAIGSVGRDMQAAKSGAFGGSRAALIQQEAQRNLGQQLDDIQTKGSQSAYDSAQRQYEADRQARYAASQQGIGAQQFNSQQQMAYGQAGMDANKFNEQQRMQAAQMGLQGDIATEQARQAAAGIRTGALTSAGQMGNALVGAGKTVQDADVARYGAQIGAGDKVQQTNQAALDAAYDNFVNQRDFDKQNLNFYSGILRGVPVSANTDVRTTQATNPLAQLTGGGIAALGAYKAYQGQ